MDEIKVEQFIVSSVLRRGDGRSDRSPIRVVTQIHAFDGTLIAEDDPNTYTIEKLVSVIKDAVNYGKESPVGDVVDRILKERRF